MYIYTLNDPIYSTYDNVMENCKHNVTCTPMPFRLIAGMCRPVARPPLRPPPWRPLYVQGVLFLQLPQY